MRKVLVAVLLLMQLLAPAGALAQADSGEPDISAAIRTDTDCLFLVTVEQDPRPGLGEISCGVLTVPENWSEPGGRTLAIRYVVLHARSASPHPDPILYLEGGPGGSALTGITMFAETFTDLRQDRDIVLFDQRGTRLSSPLRCIPFSMLVALDSGDALDNAMDDAGAGIAEDVPSLPAMPADLPAPFEILQQIRLEIAGSVTECVQELSATGVDLRQYNSIASSNDAVALMSALGYDTFNLYGISYGTRLALVIMREHPESGIRSVVLDSTFPPQVQGFERYAEEAHEVVMHLFADCERDTACNETYPDLKQRVIDLLARLRTEPLVLDDEITVTDRDLVEVLQSVSHLVPAVPYIPLMIEELERGESAVYLAIVSGAVLEREDTPEDDTGVVVDDSIATPVANTYVVPEDATPERRFLVDLLQRADSLNEAESAQLFTLLLLLDQQEPDRHDLEELVRTGFDGPAHAADREALLAGIDALSDNELVDLFAVLEEQLTFFDYTIFGSSPALFNSIECNEEIPFQSFDATVETARNLEIPELALGAVEVAARQFATCDLWPSGRADAIENQPVVSDAPTLILAGAYDFETPVSWNKAAFVTLPNATLVEFPMSAHGVILYSSCAVDVVKRYIEDPNAFLDTSCTTELRPGWVMPEAQA